MSAQDPNINPQSGLIGSTANGRAVEPLRVTEAERLVVATILHNPEVLPSVSQALSAEDFCDFAFQAIYRACQELWRSGRPVDLAAVGQVLQERRQVADIGGLEFLADLYNSLSSPGSVLYHAGIIRKYAQRRRVLVRLRSLTLQLEHPGSDLPQILKEAGRGLAELVNESTTPTATSHTWQPIPLDGDDEEETPPNLLLGLFYPDMRHLLFGETESQKTWLALCAAVEVIRAGKKVLWIDYEMTPRAIRQRLRALGCTPEQIKDSIIYMQPCEALRPDSQATLKATLDEHNPGLVVIDAISGSVGTALLDDNSNVQVEQWWQGLAAMLWEKGKRALIVIDHVNKDAQTRGRYPSGSKRKLEGADVGLQVEAIRRLAKHPPNNGLLKVTVSKDRPGWLPRQTATEVALDIDEDGGITWTVKSGTATAEGKSFRPTNLMEKASRYIEANPGKSKSVVEGNMDGQGKEKGKGKGKGKGAYRWLAIDLLIKEGFVRTENGPRKAILLTSIRPYREAAETTPSRPLPDSLREGVESPPSTTPSQPFPPLRGEGRMGRGGGLDEEDPQNKRPLPGEGEGVEKDPYADPKNKTPFEE
jgi:hypothetical protein